MVKKTLLKNLLPFSVGGKPSDRQERLGLLSIVKFANDPCGASNGSNGTCLSSNECSVGSKFLVFNTYSNKNFRLSVELLAVLVLMDLECAVS